VPFFLFKEIGQIKIILILVGGYISLVTVWLMLGAIVNPTAFLPYATGAATFVTFVSSIAAHHKEISDNGLQKVTAYVQNIAN
jgi:hypothetical protein